MHIIEPPAGRELIARHDVDANRIVLPPHVRAMPWADQVAWARDKGMQPTAEAIKAHRERGFLERAKEILDATRRRYPFADATMAAYSMFEMMQPFSYTDGATVSVVNVETVLTQDTLMTLPANFFTFPGKACWLHAMGKMSNVVTTPGNVTFRLRWNALGGTLLVASGAITPDPVAATDNLWVIDLYVKALATGQLTTSLTLLANGSVFLANAAYTLANSKAQSMPPGQTAVANVASLDGTIARALTLTAQPTLSTLTFTVRDAWIVALN